MVMDVNGTPTIVSYEDTLVSAVDRYHSALAAVDVHPRIVLILTFTGVKGAALARSRRYAYDEQLIDRDILILPDVLVNELPTDVPKMLRPVFDAVWNACGIAGSPDYDESGNWAPGRRGV
ncbi:MAG: hypothetical protein C4547_05470 [Phycisphaerales bacterium]|nr:MAG: hypothetical protein C4547_05470 [Phycisphaerales bacterium]